MRAATCRLITALVFWGGLLVSTTGKADATRYDFSDLTAEQQQRLWERVDQTAFMEASARACGIRTGIEERVRAAIGSCAAPAAFARVLAHFRQEIGRLRYGDKTAFCKDEKVRSILAKYVAEVDDVVSEGALLCQACIAVGRCR